MPEELNEETLLADPMAQFSAWFKMAEAHKDIRLPEAVHLATVGADGYPQDRVVLLKDYSAKGFVFFTNTRSAKGQALAVNPRAALTFYWMVLNRQIRIVGDVVPVSSEEADTYFASRAHGSQLSAWASAQSEVVATRAELAARMQQLAEQYPKDVPRPPHWSGYRLKARSMEFWLNREDRLHDRYLFKREGDAWADAVRLCP
jgi:pyridoxamine 5'-phosphate oxidase